MTRLDSCPKKLPKGTLDQSNNRSQRTLKFVDRPFTHSYAAPLSNKQIRIWKAKTLFLNHRTNNSRASEQPNQHRPTHQRSWISQGQLALWRVRPTNPTYRWVSWINQSNSPLSELDEPLPTCSTASWITKSNSPWASWISPFQVCLCGVGSVQNQAFSSPELPLFGIGQIVSCFTSIEVAVETLWKKRQRLIFSYKFGSFI